MIPRILIVDDEPNVRLNYRTTLETEHYDVVEASSAALALAQLEKWKFELAILDMRMPEMNGLELLERMRARGFQTPVVIITAYGDIPHAVKAMKLGASLNKNHAPVLQNMRRLAELSKFGSSKEPFDLGKG